MVFFVICLKISFFVTSFDVIHQCLHMDTLDSILINESNQKKNICSEAKENLTFGSDLHKLLPDYIKIYK